MNRFPLSSFRPRRRPGLTVLEVIVILLLAVTAFGLLVMALGRQRTNGQRLQCMNNLKRVGEAIYTFHEGAADPARGPGEAAVGRFLPAARIADGYATWAVQLGPHLRNDHPLLDWKLPESYFAQPDAVRQAVLPVYVCPARNRAQWLSTAGDIDPATGRHVPGALGDYACVAGDGRPEGTWAGPAADGPIILGEVLEKQGDRIVRWRGRTNFASLARGVSHTLMVGEKHVPRTGLGTVEGGDGSLYDGQYPLSSSRVGGPGHGLTDDPAAPLTLNFGSYHAGVCQFVLADTSVRALAVTVEEEILGKMCRRGE
jgi:hypothetical protein